MNFRKFIFVLMFGCCSTALLFAGTERGDHLITAAGGAQGIAGAAGPGGAPGLGGIAGIQGIQGIPGIPGAPGILDFGDFYALQGGAFNDNPAPIAQNVAVNFPQNGPSTAGITRATSSTFNLAVIGTYLVLFQVDVVSSGQLGLRLNGGIIADSIVGRATGSSQITGISLVNTTTSNSVLEVINPQITTAVVVATNDNVIAPSQPGSAHLVIIRIL